MKSYGTKDSWNIYPNKACVQNNVILINIY